MESILRKWRMEDKYALAALLNDRAVLDNLRDGIPFPYTVRDAEAFTHEFVTTTYHPDELMPEDRQAMTRPGPEWDEWGEAPTYHRQVTEWREVHRA